MENILTHLSSITTIKKHNTCYLYLKVTFLSNITNLKGDTLLPTSLQGIWAQNRASTYDWTRQQRSNTRTWKL